MVLNRQTITALLLAFLLASCMKYQPDQQRSPSTLSVGLATLVEYPDKRDISPTPAGLANRVERTLTLRNLEPDPLPPERFTGVFADKRTTPHRMEFLSSQLPGADLLLLVETEPRFYSQLTGRYRWTVKVRLTIAEPGHMGESVSTEVKVPVFMEYYHEKEPQVVEAAGPIIERHLGFLLDEYLGGL